MLRSSDRQQLCPALSSACGEEGEGGEGGQGGEAHAHAHLLEERGAGSSVPSGRQSSWVVTTVESTQVRGGGEEGGRERGIERERVRERDGGGEVGGRGYGRGGLRGVCVLQETVCFLVHSFQQVFLTLCPQCQR